MAVEKANPPSKAGGAMVVVGFALAIIGVGLMATVALTLPGLILLVAGLGLAACSFFAAKTAARTLKA